MSNTIATVNQSRKEGTDGSTGMFAYICIQRQFNHLYLNIFIGPRLYGTDSGPGDRSLSDYPGRVGLGLVF